MVWLAGILTTIWLLIIAVYLADPRSGIAAIDRILKLEPNNFGDFMAGAFAPPAFIILACSVFIQKKEVSAQMAPLIRSSNIEKISTTIRYFIRKQRSKIFLKYIKDREFPAGNISIASLYACGKTSDEYELIEQFVKYSENIKQWRAFLNNSGSKIDPYNDFIMFIEENVDFFDRLNEKIKNTDLEETKPRIDELSNEFKDFLDFLKNKPNET